MTTDDVITRMVANNYVSSALDPKCIACDQSETDCPYPDPLLTCKECGAFFHESCARMFSGRREDEPITDTSNAVCNDCKEMGWDTDDHIERYYETSEEDESEDDEDDDDEDDEEAAPKHRHEKYADDETDADEPWYQQPPRERAVA